MMQRYDIVRNEWVPADGSGEWVKYADVEAEIEKAREQERRVAEDNVMRAVRQEREEIAKMLDGYCTDMARDIRVRGEGKPQNIHDEVYYGKKPGKIARIIFISKVSPNETFIADKLNELIDAENARRAEKELSVAGVHWSEVEAVKRYAEGMITLPNGKVFGEEILKILHTSAK